MIRGLLTSALMALTLPALAADTHDHDHDEIEHAFEIAGLHVVHPWMRATTGREGVLFLELHNEGDVPVSLMGAEADWAETATLVGYVLKNGDVTANPLPAIPVAPGRTLDLEPNVLAIQFTGLRAPLVEGHPVALHLITSAGEIEIDAAVEPATALHHSHAGHQH